MSDLQENPFRPGFGKAPPVLVGRDEVVAKFDAMLAGEATGADQLLVIGHRGTGKTTLLNELQDHASRAGWFVVQSDAGSDVAKLYDVLSAKISTFLHDQSIAKRSVRSAGVSAFGFGANATLGEVNREMGESSFRETLEKLWALSHNVRPSGVLITIDEIHKAAAGELDEIGNAIQHQFRDNRQIAIAMAGLPLQFDGDQAPTFLSRCWQPDFAALTRADVTLCLVETAAIGGFTFHGDALGEVVDAVNGYPYMLQLLGSCCVAAAQESGSVAINVGHVSVALPEALRQVSKSVASDITRSLSPVDRKVLVAMAAVDGASRVAELQTRLGMSKDYFSVYRNRLLTTGVIVATGRGELDFAVPGLRDAIRFEMLTATAPQRPAGELDVVAPRANQRSELVGLLTQEVLLSLANDREALSVSASHRLATVTGNIDGDARRLAAATIGLGEPDHEAVTYTEQLRGPRPTADRALQAGWDITYGRVVQIRSVHGHIDPDIERLLHHQLTTLYTNRMTVTPNLAQLTSPTPLPEPPKR
jgi:hypothetical protein